MAKKIDGTLVILTLNEIEGLKKIFPLIPINKISEVFGVDGGSKDGTLEFYKKNKVKVLNQKSKGRGEAFRIALKKAKYDKIVFFSPDGNHVAYQANKLGKWYVVVDGKKGTQAFDGFVKRTPLVFDSPTRLHGIALRTPGQKYFRVEVEILKGS